MGPAHNAQHHPRSADMANKITAEVTATGTDHIGPYATITTSQGYDMAWCDVPC